MKFQPKYYKISSLSMKMHLERIERFYLNGKFILAFRTPYSLLIRGICNEFGVSPDCITKRISYKLVCDDYLPF